MREKAIIQHRLQFDSDAFESQGFEWTEVGRAFRSLQIYGYALLFHGFAFPLYSLSLFLPTIILNLGYKSWEAQLLTVPVSGTKQGTMQNNRLTAGFFHSHMHSPLSLQ